MATATLNVIPIDVPAAMSPKTPPNPSLAEPAATVALAFDRLVLTGFMGSGKTTIGGLLARRLGWTFLDLDHEIERRAGQSVPSLFAEFGEAHFRRLEAATLAAVLGRKQVVLALGGGVPEELGNRLLLEQSPRTAVIYLEAPFEELLDRCLQQPNATERPNLADRTLARQRFQRRQRLYERLARFRVPTSGRNANQTLEDVLAVFRR